MHRNIMVRFVLLFSCAIALYAGPFSTAAKSLSAEAVAVGQAIGACLIVFGAFAIIGGGGRSIAGFCAAGGGVFVLLNAQNIANWFHL